MGNYKEAIEANERIQDYSDDIFNEYMSSKYFSDLGMLYLQRQIRKLLFNSEKVSATFVPSENVDIFLKRWFSNTLGDYGTLEDIEMAIQNFNKSLQYDKGADLKYKSEIYSNLAFAYIILRDLKKSVEFNEKCLAIYEKLNDKEGINKCREFGKVLIGMQVMKILKNLTTKKDID